MTPGSRIVLNALALCTGALMLLPLLGLTLGLIYPPLNPLTGAIPLWTLLQQNDLLTLLLRTLGLALSVSVLSVFLGTTLAYLFIRTRYVGQHTLALLSLMPLAMPSYILAATLRESLSPYFTGFFPVLLTLVVITTPYVQLLVSASLLRLSSSEEEAAYILGASRWRVFISIILPHARPSIALAFLMTLLYVISEFGAVSVLNYPVLTWRLYQAVEQQQLAQATLLGSSLLTLSIPLFMLSRCLHGNVPLITQLANPRAAARLTLKPSALLFTYSTHALMIGLGVLLPLTVLGGWLWYGLQANLSFAPIAPALWDSVRIATLATGVIVLLSFAPAYFTVHYRSSRQILEQALYLSSALPGILLAFGLMLLALYIARSVPIAGLYAFFLNSGILLILGYTLCFLAQAYSSIKTALLRLDPRQYDSAQTLGASKLRYFIKIALPNLKPGIAIAVVLVFLAVLKELPVTLLLGGAMGLRPLSFRVFDRYQEAFLQDTALAGLVLLCLSFTLMAFILRWRSHA